MKILVSRVIVDSRYDNETWNISLAGIGDNPLITETRFYWESVVTRCFEIIDHSSLDTLSITIEGEIPAEMSRKGWELMDHPLVKTRDAVTQ